MEKPLAYTIKVALALTAAAPLIVMSSPLPSLFFPYIVGKALYTRLLIEIAFALWLALVLWYPAYRPPKSRLIAAFAIYVLIALLASLMGVSVQRSIWSTYERMQGWIDLAHWMAFLVVAASVFRTFRDWRVVLNFNLAVGLILGLIGLSEMYDLGLLSYLEKTDRLKTTLGNPTFVGAYMLVNALIAAAFLAHSLSAPKSRGPERSRRAVRRRRKQQARPSLWPQTAALALTRLFWAAVILLNLVILYESGTRGSIAGLAAALTLLLIAYALWGKLRRVRIAAIASLAALAVLVPAFLAVRDTEAFTGVAESNPTLRRLASIGLDDPSVRSRINSTAIGFNGFTERPILGWGPENYTIAYDKYLTPRAVAASTESFDQAHNKIIEELVTKGLLGLAGYLALWLLMAWIFVRRVRNLQPDAQLFTMFIAAALAGYFVQNLALFDTPGTAVQLYLLLGFAIYVETAPVEAVFDPAYVRDTSREALPGKLNRLAPLKSDAAQTLVLAAIGVVALAFIYFMIIGPYVGAKSVHIALEDERSASESIRHFEDAIAAAPELANYPRRYMLTKLRSGWSGMSGEERLAAIEAAEREGRAALQVEPREWRIHTALAHLYHQAAAHDPAFLEQARRHTDEALKFAPERIEVQQLLARQYVAESDFQAALQVIDGYLAEHVQPGSHIHYELTKLRRHFEETIASIRKGDGLIISSNFEVYLSENRLTYVKEPCNPTDVEALFFLHLTLIDVEDLPEGRKQHGFDNLGFRFHDFGTMSGKKCVAVRILPEYGIDRITTGQYIPGGEAIWKGTASLLR